VLPCLVSSLCSSLCVHTPLQDIFLFSRIYEFRLSGQYTTRQAIVKAIEVRLCRSLILRSLCSFCVGALGTDEFVSASDAA
jgi:hypothetical protein